jgi:hypothetical protein
MLTALAVAATVSACGTSASGPSTTLAPSNLVDHAELVKYPDGSVDRTFLEYWSNLQFHSWADVAAYYDPSFRDFIGTTKVINAKKVGATFYPFLKPEIIRVSSSRGVTTVYYSVRLEDGSKELASISWRKVGGNWQIVYDSRLDAELGQLAQEKTQLTEPGTGTAESTQPVSKEALRASKEAAQLQSQFLEHELQINHP